MPARADLGLDATKVWFSETHHWGVPARGSSPLIESGSDVSQAFSEIAGAITVFFAAGPAFFISGPFAYHGLPAFYVPVVISGAYMVLTTWYMLKELKRAPGSTPVAAASIADPS